MAKGCWATEQVEISGAGENRQKRDDGAGRKPTDCVVPRIRPCPENVTKYVL